MPLDCSGRYVIENKGIDKTECYPYAARGQPCKFQASCIGARFSKYINVTGFDDKGKQHADLLFCCFVLLR